MKGNGISRRISREEEIKELPNYLFMPKIRNENTTKKRLESY
jgi:hypothetical protein